MDAGEPFEKAVTSSRLSKLTIDRIEAVLLRVAIDRPVRTSFGVMRDRPALIVEVTEKSGCIGYGEIWCNFPSFGAEYKAHLVASEFAPALKDFEFSDPREIYFFLHSKFAVLALQCGDRGALSQVIAGIDQAVWDCFGRLRDRSLSELFGASETTVPAYASGVHPNDVEEIVPEAIEAGYDAIKVKVGFAEETDQSGVRTARRLLGSGRKLMVDANQSWQSVEQAVNNITALSGYHLEWIEEALPADTDMETWQALKGGSLVRLAGGENLPTLDCLSACCESGVFSFIQPDIGKIGGFTGLIDILGRNVQNDVAYCPHWLGGGLGLAASAHILNIVGGGGMLEVDANVNPLRDDMGDWTPALDRTGKIALPSGPGIGLVPDYVRLEEIGARMTRLAQK